MARICIIEDFIIPSLENRKYGRLLEWVDEEEGIFQVYWSHKSCSKWNEDEFTVFIDWSLAKGKNQMEANFYTDSKGRFRSALYKLKSKVICLKSFDKKYRRYQLKDYKKNNKIEYDQNVPEKNFQKENEQIEYNPSSVISETEMDITDQLSPFSESSYSSNYSSESEKENTFDLNNEIFQNNFSFDYFDNLQNYFPSIYESDDIYAEEFKKDQIENESIHLFPMENNEWKEEMGFSLETIDPSELEKLMNEKY